MNRWRKTRHRGQVAIALLKDYWGLGIGTAMFKEMIDKARQEKLEQLELEVIEGNQRAIGLYHKMGFCVHRRKAQRYPAGGWKLLKELMMVKVL